MPSPIERIVRSGHWSVDRTPNGVEATISERMSEIQRAYYRTISASLFEEVRSELPLRYPEAAGREILVSTEQSYRPRRHQVPAFAEMIANVMGSGQLSLDASGWVIRGRNYTAKVYSDGTCTMWTEGPGDVFQIKSQSDVINFRDNI